VLILVVVVQADRDGLPMYLESSAQGNIPYYKKYGFAVRKIISLDRGPKPVNLYIMVREPRSLDSLKAQEQTVTIRAV
jgi:hypothetical protein